VRKEWLIAVAIVGVALVALVFLTMFTGSAGPAS
jgi:hypothetical protein